MLLQGFEHQPMTCRQFAFQHLALVFERAQAECGLLSSGAWLAISPSIMRFAETPLYRRPAYDF
jgi:hypothetical protein